MKEAKEEKAMENQRVPEKTIPVFTVLKNGAILKNIFVINSPASSSPEEEEILLVGRHPDCDILLTHPSISRYHLQIRSLPSRQKLFVTDLSSVHGTWVSDQKVEPDACVEVKEGDVIRIGGSTRIYRLHWLPLSRAYDTDNPFVSPIEQDEEKRMLEAENLVVAHQSLADTASGYDGDGHLYVTSEGSGSSVPSEDEDTTREVSLPVAPPSVSSLPRESVNTEKLQSNEDLQTSSKGKLDVEEAAAETPINSCGLSKPQSDSYPEVLACSELEVPAEADEWDVRGDGGLLLDVMAEMIESSVPDGEEHPFLAAEETSSLPLPQYSTETEDLQLIDVVQASPELTVANAEISSICSSLRKAQIDGVFEDSGCASFELAAEAETLSLYQQVCGENECDNKQVMEVYAEPLTEAENPSHEENEVTEVFRPVIEVSSSPQVEPKLIGDAGGHLDSEVAIETDSQNLHKECNRETRITSSEVSIVSGVLSEMDSSGCPSRRLSTSNIWSRRGKDASNLQVRTNKSGGKQKQIGKPKAPLQRKQALSDAPNYLKLEPEIFTPDKENLTPNSHMLKRLREVGEIMDTKGSSSKAIRKPFFDIHVEEYVMVEQKQDVHCMSSNSKVAHDPVAQNKKAERAPFQHLLDKSSSQSQSYTEASSTAAARNNISGSFRSLSNLSDGKNKMKWIIVLDTSSLLNQESRKPLHLLQGLKGTHMVVPRTVLRELNETKNTRCILFRRTAEMASSALDWIEECKVNTQWWIQLQSPSEETKATAPTPPAASQSNGYSFPFSLDWKSYAPEIDSPTSEDQVLECALLHRNRNRDVQLVLLSNDETLKIKAMAEGIMCETAHEFYESLKNPFSERFMWPESLPRGRTWTHADDSVLRERYEDRMCFPFRKKLTFNGGRRGESGATAAKGLKLVLLYNSQYGHIR